jgi:hypothetical protein
MSSEDLIKNCYSGSYKSSENLDQVNVKTVGKINTPFGEVKNIRNRRELATVIFEEKKAIQSLSGKGFSYKQIKELDQSLDKINRFFTKRFDRVEQKKVEPAALPVANVQEAKSTPLQVLEGNHIFYVGVCTPEFFVKKALDSFIKDTDIPQGHIQLATQPHLTVVPPSPEITPFYSLKNLGEKKSVELEFDQISISKRGNINAWAKQSDGSFSNLSSDIAESLKIEKNSREPHTKLGVLDKRTKNQIFADPEKFGFEKKEFDEERLYKHIEPNLKLVITTPDKKYPDEQLILKTQCEGASPVSEEDIVRSKENFNQRVQEVELHQKEIQNSASPERKNFKYANLPFTPKKLALAIEGDPQLGRVPLTFSCRENGVLLWREFCSDVSGVLKGSKYDDAVVQMLGSGVYGFTRNPSKELKSWDLGSDADIAIFSKKMSIDCIRQKVQVNENIQLDGKRILFKNERDPLKEGKGFYDTEIGQQFQFLQEKWSKKLYGSERALGVEVDFKLNINPISFYHALDINIEKQKVNQ